MKLIIPPLAVEEDDAFKNDILDRGWYGKSLLNLVASSEDNGLVISLDGGWGEGKTTFVKMWQGILSQNKIPSIYIDVFLNDYSDDAFIPIACEILDYAKKQHVSEKPDKKLSKFRESMERIARQLPWIVPEIAINAVMPGSGVIKDIINKLLKNRKDDVENAINKKIDSHLKFAADIQSFKDSLSEISSQIKGTHRAPLVVIIDELDRCKPTFAVKTIETIKHLFVVKNIVFVLVMNKSQLEESIKNVYGRDIDAHTYLQKFIDIETRVPKRSKEPRMDDNDSYKYAKKLLEQHEVETWEDGKEIVNCIVALANQFNLSFRQLEKIFTNLTVFYASSAKKQFRIVQLIVFLAVIKVIEPELYGQLINKKVSYEEVINELELSHVDNPVKAHGENNYLKMTLKQKQIMLWVRLALLSDTECKKLLLNDELNTGNYITALSGHNITTDKLIPDFAQRLDMFILS